jgi:hypothetical protein
MFSQVSGAEYARGVVLQKSTSAPSTQWKIPECVAPTELVAVTFQVLRGEG